MMRRAAAMASQLVEWRREFHAHPELGFQEERTAGRVEGVLASLGYRVRTGIGRTGVVAEWGQGDPIVAVRADMDALPIQEENQVAYASRRSGVMHACGHDAHTAIALGVGGLLANETFPGTVRLLFQPAEEMQDDEGVSGAPRMIEDGAMEGVKAILALHVQANLPVGQIAVDAGPAGAGVDSFGATVIGRGGHAAYPHKVVDPVYIAAHVILALQGIVARRLDPFDPAVVSVGSIHGGQVSNVIPQSVELKGTLRYARHEVQEHLHVNDDGMAALLREVAGDLLGGANLAPAEKGMGAEDFGFFAALAPGAMFSLGCRIEGDERKGHNPRFDIDERCLPVGAAVLTEAVLRLLRRSS